MKQRSIFRNKYCSTTNRISRTRGWVCTSMNRAVSVATKLLSSRQLPLERLFHPAMSPKLKHSILLLLVTTASHVVSYFVETLPGPLSTVGEGPVWDIDRQYLYFVDIHECAILRYDPVQNRTYKAIIGKNKMPKILIEIVLYEIESNP